MSTFIVFSDGSELKIDATPKQDHNRTAQVTKHKVEKGSNITDHVIIENPGLSLEGIMSEFSKGETGEFLHQVTFERLEKAWKYGELVKVVTRRKTYTDMVITSFSCPVEVTQGHALFFSLQLENIRFAETQTEKVPKLQKIKIDGSKPNQSKADRKKHKDKAQKRFSEKKNKGRTANKTPNSSQEAKLNKISQKPASAIDSDITKNLFR